MTVDEYWAGIARVPLYRDRETGDGQAYLCRDINNQPVRVTKPEFLIGPGKREAALELYRQLYGSTQH